MASGIRPGDVARLTQRLRALSPELEAAARQAIQAAGPAVLAEAQRRVPVDTGDLRDSIKLENTATGWRLSAFRPVHNGRIAFNLAMLVEFGTRVGFTLQAATKGRRKRVMLRLVRGRPGNAQPFMFPAFRRAVRPILRQVRAALRAVVAKRR